MATFNASLTVKHTSTNFLAQSCGLILPTLFQRVGAMATGAPSIAQSSGDACRPRLMRLEFARTVANPAKGPVTPGRPPAKTTPTASLPDRAESPATGAAMRVAKPASVFSRQT